MTQHTARAALTSPQVGAYLQRLGFSAHSPPTLAQLHLAHLQRVPFENLDIGWGRPIRLELDHLYQKIVLERRGGYCYELNGLLAALLEALGHDVRRLSTRVAGKTGGLSPAFDHLALLVGGTQEAQLVDVGFGDAFLEPLPLIDGFTRLERQKTVCLEQRGEDWLYLEDRGEGLRVQYVFNLVPHNLQDFGPRNLCQQTAPESHFTQNQICSLATPSGRISLSGSRLIRSESGFKTETELSADEYEAALQQLFGMAAR